MDIHELTHEQSTHIYTHAAAHVHLHVLALIIAHVHKRRHTYGATLPGLGRPGATWVDLRRPGMTGDDLDNLTAELDTL